MRSRAIWPLFGLGVAAVLAALVWVSVAMLKLEYRESAAKDEALYQQNLRLALARLDRAFARLLEQEAARPPLVYAPFYPVQGEAWRAKDLKKLRPEEVFTQSPLLAEKPPFVRLHFQVDATGRFSSPQVPTGNFLELCDPVPPDLENNRRVLARIAQLVDTRALQEKVVEAEKQTAMQQAADRRAQVVANAKRGGQPDSAALGSLEPVWQEHELLYVRRVRVDDAPVLQGFLVDWQRLHATLLEEIGDIFPTATLRPAVDADTPDCRLLSLPAVLQAPRRDRGDDTRWTATHTVLGLSWTVVLLAILGAGYALRQSLVFGERQRRFASLVTHELRSPLTTFRLYSDLLAEGMVQEEAKRDLYHHTLQRESATMARMVENVIAHARIEEGRTHLDRQRILVGNLLEQVTPDLEACAAKAGFDLTVEAGGAAGAALETDVAAVGQILFNLVDNACKYGAPPLLVGAAAGPSTAQLIVRDHGPGIPPAVARRIFRPFDRGARDERDAVRGLGLGLALGRGLARDLGGDLTLEPAPDGGARFVLTLPVAAGASG